MTEPQGHDREDEVHAAVWLVPAGALLLALLPWPYSYYTLLRFVVCGAAAYLAYRDFEDTQRASAWVFVLGALAVLFNPLIPVYLSREMWAPIDVGASILLVVHWLRTRRRLVEREL